MSRQIFKIKFSQLAQSLKNKLINLAHKDRNITNLI